MRLLSLKLRGAIGIKKGLGLDEIEINFDAIDPGLVALVAPNGSGKTTILENLHPFRTLASRTGSLQQHFALKDSCRDLRFVMNGSVYRCLLLVDGVRGKQESYIYCNDEPLNDGKTPSYDEQVERLFGSDEMFFRSVFRAQGADSIAEMTDGKRKELFVELLGLSRIAEYHEEAKARVAALEDLVEGDRARIELLHAEASRIEDPEGVIEAARLTVEGVRATIRDAEQKYEAAARVVGEAEAQLAAYATLDADLQEAKDEDADNRSDVSRLIGESQSLNTSFATSARIRDAAIERAGTDADSRRAEVDVKLARVRKIASNVRAIDEGLASLESARVEVKRFDDLAEADRKVRADLQVAQENLRAESRRWDEWETRRISLQTTLARESDKRHAEYNLRIDRMEQALAGVESTAALTGEVPCTGTTFQSGCSLLRSALDAAEKLPQLREELAIARKTDPVDVPEINKLSEGLEAHLDSEPVPDPALRSEVDRLTSDVDATGYDGLAHNAARRTVSDLEAKNWTGLKAEADVAEASIADLEERLTEIEGDRALKIEAAEEQYREDVGRIRESIARNEEQLALARRDLEESTKRVEKLEAEIEGRRTYDERKAEAARDLELARSAVQTAREDLETYTGALARAEADLASSRRAAAEADDIAARIAPQIRDLEAWAMLVRATGRDGIQALELDEAGPAVSTIANDLLAETFGTRFQIAFETTRLDSKGKKTLEVFDIRVTADGVEQSIENLSGGQRVWIEASISQAVGVYLRRKSGHDLRTSFLDEADGALDSENAWSYLEMLRQSHDASGAHHTFLITHRRELLAHIPQQLRLVPGVGVQCE